MSVAQDNAAMQPFCGDLSEADCTLLRDTADAWNDLNSATYDATFNLDLADGSQTITISGGMNGAFALDRDAMPDLSGMSDMSAAEINAQTLQETLAQMGDAANALDATLTLTLDVPQQMAQKVILCQPVDVGYHHVTDPVGESSPHPPSPLLPGEKGEQDGSGKSLSLGRGI